MKDTAFLLSLVKIAVKNFGLYTELSQGARVGLRALCLVNRHLLNKIQICSSVPVHFLEEPIVLPLSDQMMLSVIEAIAIRKKEVSASFPEIRKYSFEDVFFLDEDLALKSIPDDKMVIAEEYFCWETFWQFTVWMKKSFPPVPGISLAVHELTEFLKKTDKEKYHLLSFLQECLSTYHSHGSEIWKTPESSVYLSEFLYETKEILFGGNFFPDLTGTGKTMPENYVAAEAVFTALSFVMGLLPPLPELDLQGDITQQIVQGIRPDKAQVLLIAERMSQQADPCKQRAGEILKWLAKTEQYTEINRNILLISRNTTHGNHFIMKMKTIMSKSVTDKKRFSNV